MVHQLSIALTDHSCMCQIKKKSGIVLGFIKTQNYITWTKRRYFSITVTKTKIFVTSGPLGAHHGFCTTYVVGGPLMDHLWQIYKQVIYKVIKCEERLTEQNEGVQNKFVI